MSIKTTGPLGYSDIREENYKTHWESPAYPQAGQELDMRLKEFQDGDYRNELALLNGQFNSSIAYGLSTWEPPLINQVYLEQYKIDKGLRVVWLAEGGDLFRSGFVVAVGAGSNSASFPLTGAWVKFGPENNGGDADVKVQYSDMFGVVGAMPSGTKERNTLNLASTATWSDVRVWGNYDRTNDAVKPANANIDPLGGNVQAPSAYIYGDSMWCSVVLPQLDPAFGPYFATVFPIDGRQYHTLGNQRDPAPYTITSNPINDTGADNFSEFENVGPFNATIHPTEEGFDSYNPLDENEITLYDGLSAVDVVEENSTTIGISPFPHYKYFLGKVGGRNIGIDSAPVDSPAYWVYVADTSTLAGGGDANYGFNIPYYPDDVIPGGDYLDLGIAGHPNTHPYHPDNSVTLLGEDVRDTRFGIDSDGTDLTQSNTVNAKYTEKWYVYTGDPVYIVNLASSSSYKIWVQKYSDEDFERYTLDGVAVSAPPNEPGERIVVTANTSVAVVVPPLEHIPDITSLSLTGTGGNIADIQITIEDNCIEPDPSIIDAYDFEYREQGNAIWIGVSGIFSPLPDTFGTNNIRPMTYLLGDEASFQPATTYEFRVRSRDTSTGDYSYWSDEDTAPITATTTL